MPGAWTIGPAKGENDVTVRIAARERVVYDVILTYCFTNPDSITDPRLPKDQG